MIRPKRRSPNSKATGEAGDSTDSFAIASGAATDSLRAPPPRRVPPRRTSSLTTAEIPNGSMSSRTLTLPKGGGGGGGSIHERRTSPRNKSPRKRLDFHSKRHRRIRKRGFRYWCRRSRLLKIVLVMLGLFLVSFGIAFSLIRVIHPLAPPFVLDKTKATTSTTKSKYGLGTGKIKNAYQHAAIAGGWGNQATFHLISKRAPMCTPLLSPEDVTFTLVTQLSDDRLWMMEHHCHRWTAAPISIAVFTDRTADQIRHDLQSMHCQTDLISIQTLQGYSDEDYPVNVLRNLALSVVKTTHVVYVDIDFWESLDLSHTLHLHRDTLYQDPKAAFIVPAFQLNRQCVEWRDCREKNIPVMPTDKRHLLDLMFERRADPFDPTNVGGHGTTRYGDWFDQTADQLLPIECIKSNRYEPYLVFRYCRDLPPFQEAFSGYGKNKMTWVMHLRRKGWTFWQLGESFVVHYPHLDSKSRMHWNGGENGEQLRRPQDADNIDWLAFKRGQVDHTFILFRDWLMQHVRDEARTPLCEDAMNDDERLWVDKDARHSSTDH